MVARRDDVVERFPIPLINRLEKHYLAQSTILTADQKNMSEELNTWASQFANIQGSSSTVNFKEGDAFTGYDEDTTGTLIPMACESVSGTSGDEPSTSGNEDWRTRVLSYAKNVLLLMCPPDAVARLPHTNLRNEAKQWWDVYFKQQKHNNLAEFLINELSSSEGDQNFSVQVTTHSRLLSTEDIEQTAKEIRCDLQAVHYVRLQQFHTEEQFRREVSEFFCKEMVSTSPRILIVQCDRGDEYADLLACVRHRLNAERAKVDADPKMQKVSRHVIFIVQLPRKAGGCFHGAQRGLWRSVHIEELRSSKFRKLPLITSLDGHSISSLWQKSIEMHFDSSSLAPSDNGESSDEDADGTSLSKQFKAMTISDAHRGEPSPLLSIVQLLTSCIQHAVSRLEDVEFAVESHIVNRIVTLKDLFADQQSDMASRFVEILSRHILTVLQEQDDLAGDDANAWVEKEALSTGKIQASGTFQQALWNKIQSTISPILSEIIAALDCNANLNLLHKVQPWKSELWLNLFENRDVICLSYQDMLVEGSTENQIRYLVPVQCHDARRKRMECKFPFSWKVKAFVDILLQQAESSSANSGDPILACLRSSLLDKLLGKCIAEAFKRHPEIVSDYQEDYIQMTYCIAKPDTMYIVSSALASAQRELQGSDKSEEIFDLATIHVADSKVHSRLNCLVNLLSHVTKNEFEHGSQFRKAVEDDGTKNEMASA